MKLGLVGFGAIGQELARLLATDPVLQLAQIVVPVATINVTKAAAATLAPIAVVGESLDLFGSQRPGLVVECAGHAAIEAHVLPALRAGVPCVVASIGALHEAEMLSRLEDAARAGTAYVRLIAGAVGAVDALAAARVGGLDRVRYTGRKPPTSWRGTPAESVCDLDALRTPQRIFQGSAREAAAQYPRNANVAATVALAGLGLDATQVELVADPGVVRNIHRIEAEGAFGRLEFQIENRALPTNPQTSALTVYSLARALRDLSAPIRF